MLLWVVFIGQRIADGLNKSIYQEKKNIYDCKQLSYCKLPDTWLNNLLQLWVKRVNVRAKANCLNECTLPGCNHKAESQPPWKGCVSLDRKGTLAPARAEGETCSLVVSQSWLLCGVFTISQSTKLAKLWLLKLSKCFNIFLNAESVRTSCLIV